MASNSFGRIFKITTFGESHGKAVGVVVDGCPAGLQLCEGDINAALSLRVPGKNAYTTSRKEPDHAEIISGIFEGITTGSPICILIPNHDADSSKYTPIKDLLRPGHANYTYLQKYGVFDYRGGGRSSGRETACRVAAGAIAKKLLQHFHVHVNAYIKQIGRIAAQITDQDTDCLRASTYNSPVYCPDAHAAEHMMMIIEAAKESGDSLGGIIEFRATGLPVGLGDPIYEKLEANLAKAMLSLPASKGFEVGSGFLAGTMVGSEHNDVFINDEGRVRTTTNYAGGTLGGISTGMPLVARVAFKPTSSIARAQDTLTTGGDEAVFQLPAGSRHDPCVAIRAVPVVEAMAALVLIDAVLLNRCSKL